MAEPKPLAEFRGKGVTADLEKRVQEMALRLLKLEVDLIALRSTVRRVAAEMSERHVTAGRLGGRPKTPDTNRCKRFSTAWTPEEYLAMNALAEIECSSMASIVRCAVHQHLLKYGVRCE